LSIVFINRGDIPRKNKSLKNFFLIFLSFILIAVISNASRKYMESDISVSHFLFPFLFFSATDQAVVLSQFRAKLARTSLRDVSLNCTQWPYFIAKYSFTSL